MNDEMINFFGKPLHTYTRAEALEDGVLVDVSETAIEAGFKIPVAVTRAVWDQYISWTDEDTDNQTIQDEAGRLWDILSMLMFAIKMDRSGTDQLIYQLAVIPRDGKGRSPKRIKLKSCIGGGDKGERVITIMLTTED
ncbi:MAG TPA: DUF6573 family protein [Gammaproteobacteria bacterium]|nr:DUF6573 family protein [Gammaproteobacteria bacterium]